MEVTGFRVFPGLPGPVAGKGTTGYPGAAAYRDCAGSCPGRRHYFSPVPKKERYKSLQMLTVQERKIFGLLKEGRSNKEISEAFFCRQPA